MSRTSRTTSNKPVIVLIHGSILTPSHYSLLTHHLMQHGFPVLSGLLPSTGILDGAQGTLEENAAFVRNRLARPMLENEGRDVVLLCHSASSLCGSAAVRGLGKRERGGAAGVIGQILIAGMVIKGGNGESLQSMFGGQLSGHVSVDKQRNLLILENAVPTTLADTDGEHARFVEAVRNSVVSPSLASVQSAIPRGSYDEPAYAGRLAYVKTLKDQAVPVQMQEKMLEDSGAEWRVREIESGHSPHLSRPEELAGIIVGLIEEIMEEG